MLTVQYNLFALKHQLEIKTNRPYSWREIADALGVHRNTMLNFVNNKITRVDLDILVGLVEFFRKEGLPITFFDLFIVSDTTLDPLTLASTGTAGKPNE